MPLLCALAFVEVNGNDPKGCNIFAINSLKYWFRYFLWWHRICSLWVRDTGERAQWSHMTGIEQQNIMLYSPRQMWIATLFGGPLCGIYMLTANYNRLEKTEYAQNVILIGSIMTVIHLLVALHPVIDSFPQPAYQTLPAAILWGICEKYHISKKDIIEDQRYTFRSNWTAVLVAIIGYAVLVTSMYLFYLSFKGLLFE